jgi:hypothetical protein
MRRKSAFLVTIVALLLALTLPASTVLATGSRVYVDVVPLSGANEVPGPGDPDGRGLSIVVIVPEKDLVCWFNSWRNLAPVTAGHIHGPISEGDPSPVLVPFANPAHGCIVDTDADAIAANPTDYYVNLHTAEFPPGAIRGGLD